MRGEKSIKKCSNLCEFDKLDSSLSYNKRERVIFIPEDDSDERRLIMKKKLENWKIPFEFMN